VNKPTTVLSSLQHFPRLFARKEFVFILSSQRSGSTLLKALLATAPDVSHLPEVPFHRYGKATTWQLKTLSEKKIIVLKKPSWPGAGDYPRLPAIGPKKIILLIRHPYETLLSTRKMYEKLNPDFWEEWGYERMLYDYWLPTYENLLARGLHLLPNTRIVQYESLVADPVKHSADLFQFIGSKRKEGTDTYHKRSEDWTFTTDDGGEKIKSLKVQVTNSVRTESSLLELLQQEPRVASVLKGFNFDFSFNQM
jgi:hypothetical protein